MFENFNPFNRITDCIYLKKKKFRNPQIMHLQNNTLSKELIFDRLNRYQCCYVMLPLSITSF